MFNVLSAYALFNLSFALTGLIYGTAATERVSTENQCGVADRQEDVSGNFSPFGLRISLENESPNHR
jgi:hypothetical protein